MRFLEFLAQNREKYREYLWVFYYFSVALNCDPRILNALFYTIPWRLRDRLVRTTAAQAFLHTGPVLTPDDPRIQSEAFMHGMYHFFLDTVKALEAPRRTEYIRVPRPNMGIAYYDTDTPLLLSLTYDSKDDCVELSLTDNGKVPAIAKLQIDNNHRSLWIRLMAVSHRQWIVEEEHMSFLTYGQQIHRLFKQFMSYAPEYWRKRNPLPEEFLW
jgi:hypothetical protein